ncbi:4a-hydroxytetrahydrobiopterin dehydratase [Vreelandella nanhaiensis]|uniref:Putative pterin-4-alpha-carbinolamine dehydratase n=1 Tax=Vreelandella nanhaiensis TaxID=1258546 RepID=A0A3S0Y2F0_9GAMM|nr:4a-hydroxytetrahydrobiopterin dehydratase [Halomonas nanhaiensis]RUR30518.1 4a-hydroxytetrahydrobiopterin dehydratase [Halomonas nanhaiensis]
MSLLADSTCKPCHKNAPSVNESERQAYLAQLPEWRIVEHDGIMKLSRSFSFRDFANALAFTQRVGEIAEQAGHHPAITTEWGKTTVMWWTHQINGLHLNDFILAARTDEVAE